MKINQFLIFLALFMFGLLLANEVSALNGIYFTSGGEIYYSETGANFSMIYNGTGTYSFSKIVGSRTGQYLYALSGDKLLRSQDYGGNWSVTNLSSSSWDIATDYTGAYVYAIPSSGYNPARIYRSSFYGVSFSTVSPPSQGYSVQLGTISVSEDGQRVIAGSLTGGGTLVSSTNYGSTFSNTFPISATSYYMGTCAYDTNNLYAIKYNANIYVTNNSGTNWYQRGANYITPTQTRFACYQDEVLVKGIYSNNSLVTYTSNSETYDYISANQDLTNAYAFTGSQLKQSINYGANWTTAYNHTSTISTVFVTPYDIAGENVTEINPICVSDEYLCTDPLFINGEYYCNIDNQQYCNLGCTNFIVDNSTGEVYQSTFNNCNTLYKDSTTLSYSCSSVWDIYPSAGLEGFAYFGSCYLCGLIAQNCGFETDIFTIPTGTCTDTNINEVYLANPDHYFYSTGVCTEDAYCSNECSVQGLAECDSPTSYRVCGNYDADPCLEYGAINGCTSGKICSSTGIGATICVDNTGVGLSNNTAFTVTPYATSSTTTSYNNDVTNRKLSVSTTLPYHIQDFSINTIDSTTYSSRTCNYIETALDSDNIPETFNTSKTVTFNSLGVAGYTELKFIPQDLTPITVTYKDQATTQIYNYTFLRNSTNKELCVYEEDSLNATYCDYSINSYDDLTQVILRSDFNFQTGTFTTTITFDRLQDNTINIKPRTINTLDISSMTLYSSNAQYESLKIYTYTQPTAFSSTLRQNYNYLRCSYGTTGCKTVRTYNNNNNLADNTNYFDYTICVNSLSASSVASQNAQNELPELSQGAKVLIILIIIMITLIGFSIGGYSIGTPRVGMGVGAVVSLFIMIIATIPDVPFIGGFMPIWVTIIIGVITVLVSSFLLVRLSQGGRGGTGGGE